MRGGLPGQGSLGYPSDRASGDGGNDFIAGGGVAAGYGKMVGPRRP